MTSRIAVVGMACRFPDASTAGELWDNAVAGRRAFRRLPPERIRLSDYWSEDRTAPDHFYTTEAALLRDWEFDRLRFKVAGTTYRNTDMVHWLALEVAAEALADAGFPDGKGAPHETTGVVIGNSLTGEGQRAAGIRLRWPYVRRVVAGALEGTMDTEQLAELLARMERDYKAPFPVPDGDYLAGGLSNTIAGRICNHFDLNGGGYAVDGACASSLLALTTACNALVAGDLDVAVAGGVDISIDPNELIGFSRAGALAADEMRVYDQRSAGFWPGEGCGMVVLMREEDAVARGHRVHALVAGWGVSSDGAGGITRPESDGQRLCLDRAYERAGFGIDEVPYFEGHGTGTAVGDAAELQTISEARRAAAPGAPPAVIGSVKANIGHTKAAAGMAGLIKAVMAVNSAVLPPTTGCERPHKLLSGESPALRTLRKAEPWPAGAPLRAGVSAMGFGGINTHVVIESPRPRRPRLDGRTRTLMNSPQDAELFCLDADTADDLRREAEHLAAVAVGMSRSELPDLAAHLARGLGARGARPRRAAVVAGTPAELAERLRRVAELAGQGTERHIDAAAGIFLGALGELPRIVLMFPGQGSGTRSDGGALRRRFDTVDELYETAALPADGDQVETAVAQPRIVTASVAGLRVLSELGVEAGAAVGHSLGELVALHWAGSFDEAAVLRVAAARGRAMSELSESGGAMASVTADPDTVAALIGDDPVVVAGLNSPRQTVVSGPGEAVTRVVERATRQGLRAVRLPVSHAFHSPLVAPAAGVFAGTLAEESPAPVRRHVVSTVTGAPVVGEPLDLLREQITAPVRFAEALAAAAKDADLLIEVGPGQVLTQLARDIVSVPAVATRTDDESLGGMLRTLGAAFAVGAAVRVGALFDDRFTRPFDPAATPTFITNLCEVVPEIDAALLTGGAAAPSAAPEAPADGEPAGDPLLLLRRLVAAHAEFPLEAVQADSKFLDDLHLSSIVVGEIVGEAMRRLGLSEPAAPTGYATATLGQVAETLEQLVATGQAPAEDAETAAARIVPPGVAPWVHGFAVARRRSGPLRRTAPRSPGVWRVVGEHPAAGALRAALEEAETGAGVLAILPSGPDAERLAVLRAAADAVLADKDVTRCAILQEEPGGAGFAKTLHLEAPWVATTVVTLPLDAAAPARAAAEAAATGGFTEVCYDADGTRTEPVLTPVELDGDRIPLGPDDVLLVTGGGKGITAECALSLAKETGARLALLGRSDPERDAELAANLERMAATGVTARYLRADVTDPAAVAEAVAAVEGDLGRVTGVLYGAGGNVPKLLQELTDDDYAATVDPKVAGLRAVLAAVDTAALRLLVTFGSITGRAGLRGEAHYAIANEWQSDLVERLARELPHCRCRAVEWSLWSGVGMGERLGSVESLARVGVTTITPDQGVAMLRDLVADPDAPVVTVVTGRFGDLPTVTFAAGREGCDELPLLRFLEQPRVHYPGIELVADSEVSWAADPYLAEHVFGGGEGAVVPGTVGMEMMAQAAAGVLGADAVPVLENVEFLRAVVVPEDAPVTVRVAALRVGPGRVAAAVRTSATKFQVDHFRAVCDYTGTAGEPEPLGLVRRDDMALPPMAFDPATDLYGPMLFHGPRFKLVESIHRTGAQHVTGRLLPGTGSSWFGRYLPDRLLLGDPAARDAYMQPMQTCGPTVLAIPLGVDRVVPGPRAGERAADVYIRHRYDDQCWDIEVTDRDGRVVETWQGFRTQLVSKYEVPREWVPVLLGSYLEHVLIEQELAGRVVLDVDGEGLERRQASLLAVRRLFGAEAELAWRPDGRPEVLGAGTAPASRAAGVTVSVAHAAGVTMATTTAGCDLETVTPRSEEAWTSLLGADRLALAATVAEETGEDADTAATRIWTAAECLVKAGMPVDTAVTFDSAREGGWVGLVAGGRRILTLSTRLRGVPAPVVLAVLAETDPHAGKAGELR
ncbi:type I polyketide synthase [Nonomuraea rhodomycinica]|uniref:SDR family NAD(P)-dependent oxidoreductase n=1 Tax=Nonomuraea rhodomycinica TaxID=1712872 RepID=A0A7Y6MDC0_9ACTN|nr:type I polyketide synthase [Nonomuraea rhodomycinica]NUW42785.1 SDR family NAD(P)-dependent oxidoreductase [Nonomuraea rhodomycinica]